MTLGLSKELPLQHERSRFLSSMRQTQAQLQAMEGILSHNPGILDRPAGLRRQM